MVKVDREFREILRRAAEDLGSQSELARRAGIGKQHISKYIRGDIKKMEKETWEKLAPHIRPYLPPGFFPVREEGAPWSAEVSPAPEMKSIPVISIAQAAGFDCTLEPFDDYASSLDHEEAPMFEEKEGMFAVRITGDSMTPWYPQGTIVYINGREYPSSGKRVIAKLKNSGEVVFKIFYRHQNKVMLLSFDDSGRNFIWENPNDNPFVWIYPVKYSFRDEDAIDSEVYLHGVEPQWLARVRAMTRNPAGEGDADSASDA